MGNQHIKPAEDRSLSRCQSYEMVNSSDLQGYKDAAITSEGEKKQKKRDKKAKRRSKDDMDIKTANPEEDELVVNIPKKKKDMADLITRQAIEIRSQKEVIRHGKTFCETLLGENEDCVRRIEERNQLISDKDTVIQNYSIKNENLKSQVENVNRELGEMQKVFARKQNEVLALEKQLKEAQTTIEQLHIELEDTKSRNNNGIRKREGSIRETSLTKENERLKLQLVDRENLIAEGRRVLQSLNSEKEQLQRQVRESERIVMEKQFAVDKLTREKERDKIQIRQKEMEASGKGQALDKAESDLRNIQEDLRNKDNLLSAKDRELEQNEKLLRQTNDAKRALEQRIEEGRRISLDEIAKLRQEKRNCEEQLRRVQASQQAQERAIQNIEADRNREKQSADILRRDQPWMITKDEIIISTDRVLGTGAWGRVFEGTFRGTKVAVKELHEIIQSSHNKALFEREISFVTLVRHPCILQFLGVAGYRSDSPLLVTELMDMSLADLLNRERLLTRSCVIRLGKDVAYGLNYLHCFRPRPIIHRDINPGNIMVWRHGDVWRGKLCDFGSAEFLSNNMSVNPGNPFYSAPEVESTRQTDKVDVFSYGVLLCELCISKAPDPQNRPKQISKIWNESLRRVVADCVSEGADDRPPISKVIDTLSSI